MIRACGAMTQPRNAARSRRIFDSRVTYQRAGGLRTMVMLRFSTVT